MKARIWTVPLSWEHTTGSTWCGNTRREGVGTWSGGESVGGLKWALQVLEEMADDLVVHEGGGGRV